MSGSSTKNVQELGSQVLDFLHVCSYFGFNPLFMSSKNHILQLILYDKGVVSSYQIRLGLPSVAETHPKMYLSRCNLQFSICWHAGGKVLSFEYRYSLL